MSSYTIALRNEPGQALDGRVIFIDAQGNELGEHGLHPPTTEVLFTNIPAGTERFRFDAPGYAWYGTDHLYDTNTITLIKEKKLLPILAGGVVLAVVLYKLLK